MSDRTPKDIARHEHTFVPGVFTAPDKRDFKRALNAWRQGDILHGVGLFWAGPDGDDVLTGVETARTDAASPLPVYTWDGQPADPEFDDKVVAPNWPEMMSIVTSQTCDIAPAGPGQHHPTVQVSPLERYDNHLPSVQLSIERGEYVDLIAVPNAAADGKWMANLRISMPISKAVLAAAEPVHGFATEAAELAFSERVSAKYRRPALHDALSEDMTSSLRQLIGRARDQGHDWPDMIEQFRLEIIDGTRLEPIRVRILAIGLSKLDRGDRADLRKWREGQNKSLRRNHNITLNPLRHATLPELTVFEYRNSVQLRVPELGQSLMYF